MTKQRLITFQIDDYVDDVKEEMGKVRHRDFPVLNENGNYVGMVSRRNLMNMQKKQVILVDHNEKSQAVDGIGEAEILEIIDTTDWGALRLHPRYISAISRWAVPLRSYIRCIRRNRWRFPNRLRGF